MLGPMGSGKTTFALKISNDTGAIFYSLDKTIKEFNLPIYSFKDYESNVEKALGLLRAKAIQSLNKGHSVVFDFGGGTAHWSWLKNISDSAKVNIEIYSFEVPTEERISRVRKRNREKPKDIYYFTMSDEEFYQSKNKCETPPPNENLKITRVSNFIAN
jgi:shikimate kinase